MNQDLTSSDHLHSL